MVTRSPRGRAFQDIVIQSLECKLAETVGFFSFLLDLFELDAKLLGHRKVSVLCVSQQRQAFFGHHFFRAKVSKAICATFLQA